MRETKRQSTCFALIGALTALLFVLFAGTLQTITLDCRWRTPNPQARALFCSASSRACSVFSRAASDCDSCSRPESCSATASARGTGAVTGFGDLSPAEMVSGGVGFTGTGRSVPTITGETLWSLLRQPFALAPFPLVLRRLSGATGLKLRRSASTKMKAGRTPRRIVMTDRFRGCRIGSFPSD
jgi:hypothetical protein